MDPVLCVIKHTFLHQFAGHLRISHLLWAALPFQEAAFLRDEKSRLWHGGEFVLLLWAVLFALCNLYRFPQTTWSGYIWFLLNGKTLFLFHIDLCEERTDIRPNFRQLDKENTSTCQKSLVLWITRKDVVGQERRVWELLILIKKPKPQKASNQQTWFSLPTTEYFQPFCVALKLEGCETGFR